MFLQWLHGLESGGSQRLSHRLMVKTQKVGFNCNQANHLFRLRRLFQGSSANTVSEWVGIIFLVFKKDAWALFFVSFLFFHEAEESQRLNIWSLIQNVILPMKLDSFMGILCRCICMCVSGCVITNVYMFV